MSECAPKQWALTRKETLTSFQGWKNNLLYRLKANKINKEFLKKGAEWKACSDGADNRGLVADDEPIPEADRLSAGDKVENLELMLGQIANYCPIIDRTLIVDESTCLNDIWELIKEHYGFQSTGSQYLDMLEFKQEHDESYEDLYQRIRSFVCDNLLKANSKVLHFNKIQTNDESLSPSLQNMIVVIWLKSINPCLPTFVKQRYGTELRNKTLASIKSEISTSLQSLLDEMQTHDEIKACRSSAFRPRFNTSHKACVLCKEAGRQYNNHDIGSCRFLPTRDRKRSPRFRTVTEDDPDYEESEVDYDAYHNHYGTAPSCESNAQPSIRSVDVMQSPYLNAFYKSRSVRVTLDSGATSSLIRQSCVNNLGIPVKPTSHRGARLADGNTSLNIKGEIHCYLTRGDIKFRLDALVVDKLDVDILVGMPFLAMNEIVIKFATNEIIIQDTEVVRYNPPSGLHSKPAARRTQSFLLRGPDKPSVLMPGDHIDMSTPLTSLPDIPWAVEPRMDSPLNSKLDVDRAWPRPQVVESVDHKIRLVNDTQEIITLKKHEHIAQVHHVSDIEPAISHQGGSALEPVRAAASAPAHPYSERIQIDPQNQLRQSTRDRFTALHITYDCVFNPSISKYNGASGQVEAVVNMGPTLPPQRKGRLPHYNKETAIELQAKFDELESAGVFIRPEQAGVVVEYLNMSFLVKKPNGGSRLVTSFGDVASYSKPQPSVMPSVDKILRDVAQWKYIIQTDLNQAFYQIPLAKASMKYCGVSTPFKGTLVYQRSAMGMPGSETCLEELLNRVLGAYVQQGIVAKLADDLYVGGNTEDEVLQNWACVLAALKRNELRLSAHKTCICPASTNLLGWVWSQGTLKASPHKVSALSNVKPPTTVHGLRSFIGAYKVLSRVLHGYEALMHPLELLCAGRPSKDKIVWSDDMLQSFTHAQSALKDCKTIYLPRPTDTLWIVTDGSVKNCGISATLYCMRDGKLLLGGFFNAKLRHHQVTWLPCEVEAFCIGAAIKHFSPLIIQSSKQAQILTDSRPCVQACTRLSRGEFSNSARVTTFLSAVSRYNVLVRHISGAVNLPTDYTSRHPTTCENASCQVCLFIEELEDSVVRNLSVKDITNGTARMPYLSRSAWLLTQQDCPDMRRACAHLTQGTRPSKKATKIPDVKRYLNILVVAPDGLLVAKDTQPFSSVNERIAIPRAVIDGLLTTLHIKFDHPSAHQLKQLFCRYFFALDLEKCISRVTSSCHHCNALKSMPVQFAPQSSEPPPEEIGASYAADIMKRNKQLVLVLRETVTSFTYTAIVASECHADLRDTLLKLTSQAQCRHRSSGISVRVDSAPGLQALKNDALLIQSNVSLIFGRVKNINKNPVAERAIEELGREILCVQPNGGAISEVTLAWATSNMNARIRRSGLSSWEAWTKRDQLTGEPLPVDDRELIIQQHLSRLHNHPSSSKTKAHGRTKISISDLHVGDLVYLKQEYSKSSPRDRYMIVAMEGNRCSLRKFTDSQFRARTYDVMIWDCFLACSPQPKPLCIVPDQSDSSDDDIKTTEENDNTAQPPPEVPGAIAHPLPDNHSPDDSNIQNNDSELDMVPQAHDANSEPSDNSDDDSDNYVPDPPRRSERNRVQSKKYNQDTWEL